MPKRRIIFAAVILIVVAAAGYWQFGRTGNGQQAAQTETPAESLSPIPGWWFEQHFGASVCDRDICKPGSDPDGDKLSNAQEYYYKSSPLSRDSNSNGLSDGEDVAYGYDPSRPGRVKLEQVASDDNIFSESLVFNNDVKQIVNELVDPTKLVLPAISDLELKISPDNSAEARAEYLSQIDGLVSRAFPGNFEALIAGIEQNPATLDLVKTASATTIIGLKQTKVPSEFVNLHKYLILLIGLLPEILDMPSQQVVQDVYSEQSNLWYDNVRVYMALLQRVEFEKSKHQIP